jgi:prolyl-tRNA editing enzyme YbaK/EbsC (Cys-tRNA(Pro) deacylase)
MRRPFRPRSATGFSALDAVSVRQITGFAIGGVAPLGSLTPLDTFIDADLMAFDIVWAAAGAPHSVFGCDPRTLAAATGAKVIRLRPPER